jgi:hypothetical protein
MQLVSPRKISEHGLNLLQNFVILRFLCGDKDTLF